ncbi:uncharacterized membrane protein YkvA (DUF1232 family) [Flavobacterium sp. CG_9.10]|uniref:YkvA family protein n=1 Tax=Flavobacterium sp. CG_9.10 TaxID=2787729 RepID=UPI0018CAA39A|nr:YkvA family protein [Flavobacterium sp. CG_9.10]MBG6112113.1 uncharacterized membrane protein YkvA (DUF1232 family) [Flavobacterium sp. CG_9.10]
MLKKIKVWASKLKQQARILQIVYQDQRTPIKAKILIWITLGYLFSPIDLIPDFIPVLGLVDDIIIVPILIAFAIKLVPKAVWADAEDKVQNQPQEKWKLNWMVLLFICCAWLTCAYFIYNFVKIHYYK